LVMSVSCVISAEIKQANQPASVWLG